MSNINCESGEKCVICLDTQPKKWKYLFFCSSEKIEPIHCSCNGFCHRSCILKHIIINNNKQKCILCNLKTYDPIYKQSYIKTIQLFFIYILKKLYNIVLIIIFLFLLYLFMGYIVQLLKFIIQYNININPFVIKFFIESLFMCLIFNLIIVCCTVNNNDIFIRIIDWIKSLLY
jgi:hypothetical protein